MQGITSSSSPTSRLTRPPPPPPPPPPSELPHHFDHTNHDDFLDQMLCNLPPSWSDLPTTPSPTPNPKSPLWDLNNNSQNPNNNNNLLFNNRAREFLENQSISHPNNHNLHFQLQQHDESALLASRLRQHQITTETGRDLNGIGAADSVVLPIPLTLGSNGTAGGGDSSNGDGSIPGLFNGLSRTQQFHQNGSISTQNYGTATAPAAAAAQGGGGGGGGNGGAPPVRQRVRARRGQATDPHSIAERLRRERIAERMKGLQELVPNANKTDKASMLDEIIDYVKFLQLQVKVLSMSRLGGAAAVAPLVADMSSEGGGDSIQASGKGRSSNGTQTASPNGSLTVTEHQVAKLMEEDMGSAMQYLQGKGLCLMPISLATAISTATCNSRNPKTANPFFPSALDGPTSPSVSVLTVQSATVGNGLGDTSVKDSTSVSKP